MQETLRKLRTQHQGSGSLGSRRVGGVNVWAGQPHSWALQGEGAEKQELGCHIVSITLYSWGNFCVCLYCYRNTC